MHLLERIILQNKGESMKNKMRLRNKFKNKFLKKQENAKMDKLRKTLLRDLEDIQKKPRKSKNAESKDDYSFF